MGLSGLDIYKQLPKKNCGECGPPTCLAFAMSLAAGKAALDACPYVSDEARENLASAAAPPIRLVTVGTGEAAVGMGDETVIFRHEKTFVNPTGVFVEVKDDLSDEELKVKLEGIQGLVFERVGMEYAIDGLAIRSQSGDAKRFLEVAKTAAELGKPLILIAEQNVLEEAAPALAEGKPLLYAATEENFEAMTELAKKCDCPLAILGDGLDKTAELAKKIAGLGHKDFILDTGNRDLPQAISDLTQIRRHALKKFRPLGYPAMTFTTAEDPEAEMVEATALIAKYVGLLVIKADQVSQLLPLLSWRQNLYTDPQKPIQVKAGVYEVGDVTPQSPVYVTTNFSLTYYSVEGEVQSSKIPSYIIAVDTEGTSVLTAWAAGKLTSEAVAEMLEKEGMEDKVEEKRVVLPGHVAVLSGKLKELSGWEVLVGPREASGIPAFAKSKFA